MTVIRFAAGKSLWILGVALLLTFFAAAADAAPASPSGSVIPPVTKKVLPNGLTVLVQERHTAPVVSTMVWYKVGSRDELPGSTGLAHFLEHLMFKGTRRYGKGMVDRLTYQNGGSNNAFTSNDYTAYFFNFPKTTWQVALKIEADRMRNILIDPKEFEAERKVVMEERRQSEDDPASQLWEQLNSVSFLAHPYRYPTIGWMSDLRRVPRAEVVAFYEKFYVPANAVLVIAGDVKASEAVAAATAAFAAVPRLPAPRRTVIDEPAQTAQRRVDLSLPANLPRLEMIFHVPKRGHADLYPLEVMQYILSEGKTSRLYQRLVERDRVASDVGASLEVARDPDQFDVSVELKPGSNPGKAEASVWDEFRRLAAAAVSDRELQQAKNAIEARFVQERRTAQGAAMELGAAEAIGGFEYLLTYMDRIQAVTAADVQRVARAYLGAEKATVGHLTPRAGEAGRPSGARGVREGRPVAARSLGAPVRRWSSRRRTSRPAPKPAAPEKELFAPLNVTERTLPNGMKLLLLENHDVPSVTFSALVRAGAVDDTDASAGLANFVARTLEEGTRTRTHQQISEALEFVGASFGASPGRNTTTVGLTTLSRYSSSLLGLYAELLTQPTFPNDRIELDRTRLLADIAAGDEDPGDIADRLFHETVYGKHPHHRPPMGYPNTVRALTPAQLRQFHRTHYVPGNTTLAVVGDFDAERMLSELTAAFGRWSGPTPSKRATPPAPRRPSGVQRVRRAIDKAQTHVMLGHPGIPRVHPDYIPLMVMDSILGEGVSGGFTARIPYQLRDVQGLAYAVGSSITSSATLDPGAFAAQIGTEPVNEERAVAALLAEIRRIREEPVKESELREAVNYLVNNYVFDFQTHGQLASYLLAADYYGLGFDYRQRFPQLVRQVTREDVQRVAKLHLDPANYALIVVGPEKKKP